MKLLTVVLVLLVASTHVAADSSSTITTPAVTETSQASDSTATSYTGGSSDTTNSPGSTAPAGTGSTLPAGTGSTVSAGSDATSIPGSTDGSNTGSTGPVATTTPTPMKLSTFPVSNGDNVLDAKLILQQAVQLDQQINKLNDDLKQAQADTDPNNSPLFGQLQAFSPNITSQNNTLQGYVKTLQTLSTTQSALDLRVTSATNTFVCFSQSSCVTDVPTTPEPTSPGPTPSVTPCTNKNLIAEDGIQTFSVDSIQNAAQCAINVAAKDTTYNVTLTINVTITGTDAFVTLVEKRTQQNVTINGSTNYTFVGFQEVDVYYYSGPRSTVQFSFDYKQVNNCNLDCNGNNGKCKVSQSGVQYCDCKKCEYTGDDCKTPIADPCSGKQQRTCGATGSSPYGTCYKNPCFDQCYACLCVDNAADPDSKQKCNKPEGTYTPGPIPTPNPDSIVCDTTPAPTTTPALLTSTIAPSGSSTGNPSMSTGGSTASPGAPVSSASPQTTITSDYSATTTGGSDISSSTQVTTPTAEASSSATSVKTTS